MDGLSIIARPGTRRTRAPRPDRRHSILLAAEKLFACHGYHAVTIRRIAEEAGVPLALVGYDHGPKHALFHAIFEHWSHTIEERLARLAAVRLESEEGYFKKRNLDVEPKFIPLNPTIPAALQSDSLQIGGPTPSVFLRAVDGGLDLVLVAGGGVTSKATTGFGLVARAGSGIRTPQDCVGRKIGVPGLGARPDADRQADERLGRPDERPGHARNQHRHGQADRQITAAAWTPTAALSAP